MLIPRFLLSAFNISNTLKYVIFLIYFFLFRIIRHIENMESSQVDAS